MTGYPAVDNQREIAYPAKSRVAEIFL